MQLHHLYYPNRLNDNSVDDLLNDSKKKTLSIKINKIKHITIKKKISKTIKILVYINAKKLAKRTLYIFLKKSFIVLKIR